eukprot:365509-Chlamydomonas_euryale.AAC.20
MEAVDFKQGLEDVSWREGGQLHWKAALSGPATVADGSGAALHPRRFARRSRAPCRRSEACVARPPRDDRRKRDPSADPAQDRRHPTHGLVGLLRHAAYLVIPRHTRDVQQPRVAASDITPRGPGCS